MAAAEDLTWDIELADGGARRPSLEDVGGATLEDDEDEPPDYETMPYAALLNQLQKQVAALAKVAASVGISVRFDGTDPFVYEVTAPGTNIVTGTITPTDNGTGDTTLSWAAGTFPPSVLEPMVTLNEDIGEMVTASAELVANGVRVRTRRSGGLVDVRFTVIVR